MLTRPGAAGPIARRASTSTSTPRSCSSGTRSNGIDMRFAGHTHFVTVGLAIGRPRVRGADVRASTGSHAAAGGAGALAGRRRSGRARRVDDGRELARVRLGRARGRALRAEGALAAAADRPAGAHGGAFRPRARDPPGRDARTWRRSAATGGDLLDPAEVAGTPASTAEFVRGSKGEFGMAKSGYVASRLRVVQRPQRVLPGVGPPGGRAGHRLEPLAAAG